MALQNRVDPRGRLVADPARGGWTGNRGVLHDEHRTIVRQHAREVRWIVCALEFKGRRRVLMTPGRYTELFFLDECTALAAGHRPCAECRRDRFAAFLAAWPAAAEGDRLRAGEVDRRLHAERLDDTGARRTHLAAVADLPDGTMVEHEGAPHLVRGDRLWRWTHAGYESGVARPGSGAATVLTPPSTVGALAAGYRPEVHPTAGAGARPTGAAPRASR